MNQKWHHEMREEGVGRDLEGSSYGCFNRTATTNTPSKTKNNSTSPYTKKVSINPPPSRPFPLKDSHAIFQLKDVKKEPFELTFFPSIQRHYSSVSLVDHRPKRARRRSRHTAESILQ